MCQEYDIADEKDIQEQKDVVSTLEVEFLRICELVKFQKVRLEARTAFVTLDSEEAYERIKTAYMRSMFGRVGPPSYLKLDGNFALTLSEPARPSDYIWENVSTPWYIRTVKVFVSGAAAVLFLLISFAAIVQVFINTYV